MPRLADLFDDARSRLAGTSREALARWREPKRLLGIPRSPRIERAGEAWHLGVLLITEDEVFATGEIVRAREEVRRGYAAESQRERAAIAGIAFRGGFAEGETLHLGWEPIDLAAVEAGGVSGPLSVRGGIPLVRWSASGWMPLEAYLRDRLSLLG